MENKNTSVNIAIICGCLEPGKDGVGDYSRVLASFLQTHSYRVLMIATNDFFVEKITDCQNKNLSFFRLPNTGINDVERSQYILEKLEQFECQIVSIQYVPFSFHSKGLAFNMVKLSETIGKKYFLHFMFHELWVGMAREDSFKFKLWGWLQKKIIQKTLQKSRPALIHTQLDLYKQQLERLTSQPIHKIPLVSNLDLKTTNRTVSDNPIKAILFGGIYPGTPAEAFLEEFKTYLKQKQHQLHIHFVGNNGQYLNDWTTACQKTGIAYDIAGMQAAEKIGEIVSECHLAICTTPYVLIEKSGSAIAMLQAGLPVVCVARQWNPYLNKNSKQASEPAVFQYIAGNKNQFESIFASKKTVAPNTTILADWKDSLEKSYYGKS